MNRLEPIPMLSINSRRSALAFGMLAVLWLGLASCGLASAAAEPDAIPSTALDRGFLGLSNLDFAGAQKDFSAWENQHPDDPVGPVSQAADFFSPSSTGWEFLRDKTTTMTKPFPIVRHSAPTLRSTTSSRWHWIMPSNWRMPG